MFYEMRRKKQQLSAENCIEILEKNTSGVLAVYNGEYPYAVPLSYVYDREANALYFHCAKVGNKLNAIKNCANVSFCVTDQDFVVPEKYTTYFRSVIVFGKAEIMENEAEILAAIEKLALKYHPTDSKENRDDAIKREIGAMCMVKIGIAHMTGKEAIELVRNRTQKTE